MQDINLFILVINRTNVTSVIKLLLRQDISLYMNVFIWVINLVPVTYAAELSVTPDQHTSKTQTYP